MGAREVVEQTDVGPLMAAHEPSTVLCDDCPANPEDLRSGVDPREAVIPTPDHTTRAFTSACLRPVQRTLPSALVLTRIPVSGYAENNFCQSLAINLPERVARHSVNGHQQLRHFVIR